MRQGEKPRRFQELLEKLNPAEGEGNEVEKLFFYHLDEEVCSK